MKFGIRTTEGGPRYDQALNQAVWAEELGFDSVWLGEHHGMDDYWPSPQVALAGFATRTKRVALGTNILILPLVNPIRLAGEIALLDQISHGRVVLGVGIGWSENEFFNMKVPIEHRGGRLREYVLLLRKLWTEKQVNFEGRFWTVKDFSCSPRPCQVPSPPIWIGGRSTENLKRAAEIGDAWVSDGAANLAELKECRRQYDEFLVQAGRDLYQVERPTTRYIIMATTHAEAWERAQKYLAEEYGPKLQHGNPMTRKAYAQDFNALISDRHIVGDPVECIEWIQRLRQEVGINHLMLKFSARLSLTDARDQMEAFATKVMPHFK